MKMLTRKTSFGRVITDGSILLVDRLSGDDEGQFPTGTSNVSEAALIALAEELWTCKPPSETLWIPESTAKPCPHPNGLKPCPDCRGSKRRECYECAQATDCDCEAGTIKCGCLAGFVPPPRNGPFITFPGLPHSGINPAYYAAVIGHLGSVESLWHQGDQFRAICERGRAFIMEVRL